MTQLHLDATAPDDHVTDTTGQRAGRRRRARWILGVAALVAVVTFAGSRDTVSQLSPGGYEVPGSASSAAAEFIAEGFADGPENLAIALTPADGDPGSASARADAGRVLAVLGEDPSVWRVESFWTSDLPSDFLASDGHSALVTAVVGGTDEDLVFDHTRRLVERLESLDLEGHIEIGGVAAVNLDIVDQVEADTVRGELIALPLTLVLLVVVFRGWLAAGLALLVAAVTVPPALFTLEVLGDHLLVNVFSATVASVLGLAMAIDFTLFIVNRYREELGRRGHDEAVDVALRTAGRAARFSGLTTASSIAGLFLFDLPLLRSFAIAGVLAVGFAMLGATIVLPAALTLWGPRIGGAQAPSLHEDVRGRWYRWSRWVARRPARVACATTIVLLLLAMPFLRVEFGLPDHRVLPDGSPTRGATELIARDFPGTDAGQILVALPSGSRAEAQAWATRLSTLPGVAAVDGPDGRHVDGHLLGPTSRASRTGIAGSWLTVTTESGPFTDESAGLVEQLRADPALSEALVGGEPARLVDVREATLGRAPIALGWVGLSILILLVVAFRSIVIPVKAFLLNLLSLAVMFGALVVLFQEGALADLLAFTPTGQLDSYAPFLMVAVAFGLSMDYEVFLMSRVREAWRETGDTTEAVARGLQRTGGIISASVVLMSIVFLSFAAGGVTLTKILGVGLALSILVDATLVRGLLVPSLVVLGGAANWRPLPSLRRHRVPAPTRDLVPSGSRP
ncbi:MAG: MMPL family transporter [Actinomycetota bacterium]